MGRDADRRRAGILLVDKPAGPTSHDVVDVCRDRLPHVRKIGHAGTLDPAATGLLVVLVGRPATRRQSEYMGHDKTYEGTVRLGAVTDTDDAEGEVIREADASSVDPGSVREAAADLTGPIDQIPPMYSALKHRGKPLYAYAREGREVEREARRVTVHELSVEGPVERDGAIEVDVRVRCSKGTYVRALARDLGEMLGCGAHLSTLRRLASGPHHVDDALPLATVEESSLDELLGRLRPVD